MKIVIVGGGTAGWFAAGYFVKMLKDVEVTVVESPNIPKIGVGESMHPYVSVLLLQMGVDPHHWMRETGSTYKLGNKLVGWVDGDYSNTHSAFTYSFNPKLLFKEVNHVRTIPEWLYNGEKTNVDYLLEYVNKTNQKYDHIGFPHYHYCENLTLPFEGTEYLGNDLFTWSQHINSDTSADYVRDYIGLPNGVKHIQKKVVDVELQDASSIKSITLDDGEVLNADFFIDCSGFSKVLLKKTNRKFLPYNDNLIDSAWVCQTEYEDPATEMTNYTQSIAEPYGWRFKVCLYHRAGNGYCFSSKHVSDADALEYFKTKVPTRRAEPRLLKWRPERIEKFVDGNVLALGLSAGFIEPIEATNIYVIASAINNVVPVIKSYQETGVWDYDNLNNKLAYAYDDVADFSRMQYALSTRRDTQFWLDMTAKREQYLDLPFKKFKNPNHTMTAMAEGRGLFPEYTWALRAKMFGIDTSSWYKNDPTTYELAKLHYEYSEQKHRIVSKTRENNYEWHKKYIFNNMSPRDWGKSKGL